MSAKKVGTTGLARSDTQVAAFEALIAAKSDDIVQLARQARSLIQQVMPDVIETVWLAQGTSSYGIGPKKMSEHFVYFTFAKRHLGFGFYYGADLPDPKGILQGAGKSMRSAKISKSDQLGKDLEALVGAASQHFPKLSP